MGDLIKLSSPPTREYWEIPVLFEDEHLLALDKPSRLLVSPDRYDPMRPNLMKLLHRDIERGAEWARGRQLVYLANAHRLDFETTGVLLLAKDKPSLVQLANQFGIEKPRKIYLALVRGTPPEPQFRVNARLAPHPVQVGRMRIDAKSGKPAQTDFAVLEAFAGYTLLQCQPLTGRTHQIRVHLQSRRLRLLGDKLYGGPPLLLSQLKPGYKQKPNEDEHPLLGRTALHAAELTLDHPLTGVPVTITSPWPRDLTVAVKYLRRFAALNP